MRAKLSREFLATMASLMAKAAESNEGLQALAAAIAKPIETSISTKEITTLLLTQHDLPVGEEAKYQKKPKVKAFWISPDGEARETEVGRDEVTCPTNRVHANPMVDISVLKHGNVGTLMDVQQGAADEIRKEIDKRTITVISAAVPAGNVVNCAGGVLTETALNEAVSLLEDQELTVKWIVMRGKRFNDLRTWDLDPVTDNELRTKGVIKNLGTGSILLTSSAGLDEVLVIPDEEIGKFPVRERLKTEAIDAKTRFKTGWLIWEEVGHIVTRPDIVVKIVITPAVEE